MSVDEQSRAARGLSSERRPTAVRLLVATVLLVVTATALVLANSCAGKPGALARPMASVWLKSSVARCEDGGLALELHEFDLVIRDGGEEVHLNWVHVASEVETRMEQTDNVQEAQQAVSGTVAYVAPVPGEWPWSLLPWTRKVELAGVSFEFTGEFEKGMGGDRWWRLRERGPNAEGGARALIKVPKSQ